MGAQNGKDVEKGMGAGTGYGETVLTLSFGDACKIMKMDRNYELALLFNCGQQVARGLTAKNKDLLAVAGRVEETPGGRLLGRLVFYRARPEEWRDAPRLQKTVDAIFDKWNPRP